MFGGVSGAQGNTQGPFNRLLDLPHIISNAVPALPVDPVLGVIWQLLPTQSSTTVAYSEALCQNEPYGVGASAIPNYLYDVNHCNQCNKWIQEVNVARIIFLMLVEHLLLFLKIFLAMVIPDKPSWVVKAEARSGFAKEELRKKGSIHVMSTEENAKFAEMKKATMDGICDDDPTSLSVSQVTGNV